MAAPSVCNCIDGCSVFCAHTRKLPTPAVASTAASKRLRIFTFLLMAESPPFCLQFPAGFAPCQQLETPAGFKRSTKRKVDQRQHDRRPYGPDNGQDGRDVGGMAIEVAGQPGQLTLDRHAACNPFGGGWAAAVWRRSVLVLSHGPPQSH